MDRDCANKIITLLRTNYPSQYKSFTRDMFVNLCNDLEKAYKKYPNSAVLKKYDEWMMNSARVPSIGDIIVQLARDFPVKSSSSDPSTWQYYEDEKGRPFVIVPYEVGVRVGLWE